MGRDAKRPAFQFYPGDWRRDLRLRACSLRARGLWIELLCLMHDGVPYGHLATESGPIPTEALARMVGAPRAHVEADLQALRELGVYSVTPEGALYSRRMVRDEALRQQRATWGALGAEHGVKGAEYGPRGGRPKNPPSTGVSTGGVDGVSETRSEPPPASASAVASALPQISRKKSCLARHRETAGRLLAFLNEATGRSYRAVEANLTFIAARLDEGATEANCRGVIARKAREWKGTEMAKYLRPETLFNRTKFESYLGERESHGDG